MNLFELSRKSLFVMLLSLMALVMLPACSSTEEAPATETGTAPPADSSGGVPTGDQGVPCDISGPSQAGCEDYKPDF
jgi:hypothetical protein